MSRVLRLLEYFADAQKPQTLSEIQRHLKVPPSSCHVVLQEMVRLGYLRMAEHRQYAVASEMIVLGARIRSGSDLIAAASGVLEATQSSTGETVYLGMAGDKELIFIATSEAQVGLVSRIPIGSRRPLHASSSGHVYLAYGIDPKDLPGVLDREPLKAYTAWTPTKRAPLLKHIAKVREQGYAVASQCTIIGAFGVSAPIFHAKGTLAGVLSLSAPITHYNGSYDPFIKPVVKAAREISRKLNYKASAS